MSFPSTIFQDLDVCGNFVTQQLNVSGNTTLSGNNALGTGSSFNSVNGFFLSNAAVNQFSLGATFGNNSTFQKRVKIGRAHV